jgi:hypothetical protein
MLTVDHGEEMNSYAMKQNAIIEKIKVLIGDYKVLKQELNTLTKRLDELYNEETSDSGYLPPIYATEDRQFTKLIETICCYQDLVTMFNRLEADDSNRFSLNALEKDINNLEQIESYYYFEYKPTLPPEGETND